MSFMSVSKKIGDKELIIETGKLARQANGSVVVKYGGNTVLVTACAADEANENQDFFPLTVNYNEKYYAAGKIPGGYLKREGKPSDDATLMARVIDRPIRPLFPKQYLNETQVIVTTLSADQVFSIDAIAIVGASAALSISDIPFLEPAGGVRIAYKDGEYYPYPTLEVIDEAQLDIMVAGTREGITMVEGGGNEVPEEILLKAMQIAQEYIIQQIELIEEMVDSIKPEKMEIPESEAELEETLKKAIIDYAYPLIKEANSNPDKKARSKNIKQAKKDTLEHFEIDDEHENYKEIKEVLQEVEVDIVRSQIIDEDVRCDGRKMDQIRDITIDIDLFDNLHGSALFTRGQTQSLGVITLGSTSDVKYIDGLETQESQTKSFMLHYNFPPFSVGEVRRMLSVSRREIGHGHLAERALKAILPKDEDFPYTIRLVSEILESNGSSSMATVCSGSLALMSAGVPIKKQVAGIAMGLVWNKEKGVHKVLSDIQGLEDHEGDMDFKVAGTDEGITAFQMDVKTVGITMDILTEALGQAKQGRLFILEKMNAVLNKPREEVSENAPKVKMIPVPPEAIGGVIGSGGKTIKRLIAENGVDINIDDNGFCTIYSRDSESIANAERQIKLIIRGPRKGDILTGVVDRIEDYGVFLEFAPGVSGLLHVSKFKEKGKPEERFEMGQEVTVMITGIDDKRRAMMVEQ